MIVTLALTSMVIAFAYGALSYVQQLFYSYKDQNRFMQEYTEFKKRMDHEALYADYINEERANCFKIKRDSSMIDLEIKEKVILMKKNEVCDTFHIVANKMKKNYETMKDPAMMNKLLNHLYFETEFSKQKFNFEMFKSYDASIKLKLDKVQ